MGAGDVAVAVGAQLPIHDLLLADLHEIDPLPAGQGIVIFDQPDHARHGDRVADHGRLGHRGAHGLGHKTPLGRFGFPVVLVDRVGVSGLHPDDLGQAIDDADLLEFDEPVHHRRDVAGVTYGHHHDLVGQLILEFLGDFVRIGLLAQNAPGVLGIEQGHVVMVGKRFHDLHAIVEHAGNFVHPGAAAQRLRQLLRGHLLVRQQDRRFDVGAQIAGIQRRGGRSVARGSAHGQDFRHAAAGYQKVDVAQGRSHAAVLEGRAGVLSVVFVVKAKPDIILQAGVGLHHRRVPLAQIDDRFERNHRADQFVIAINTLERRQIEHAPVIEDPVPQLGGNPLEAFEVLVDQHQHLSAAGAGVQQGIDPVAAVAPQAGVNLVARGLRDQIRLNIRGEKFRLHGAILSMPPM